MSGATAWVDVADEDCVVDRDTVLVEDIEKVVVADEDCVVDRVLVTVPERVGDTEVDLEREGETDVESVVDTEADLERVGDPEEVALAVPPVPVQTPRRIRPSFDALASVHT